MLVREQVARINVCRFCMDIGRSFRDQGVDERGQIRRAGAIPTRATLFTDARVGGIGLCDGADSRTEKVEPDTFARMARYYSEREICEIVWLIASEHFYNMTNIGLNIHSDMLCDIFLDKAAKKLGL